MNVLCSISQEHFMGPSCNRHSTIQKETNCESIQVLTEKGSDSFVDIVADTFINAKNAASRILDELKAEIPFGQDILKNVNVNVIPSEGVVNVPKNDSVSNAKRRISGTEELETQEMNAKRNSPTKSRETATRRNNSETPENIHKCNSLRENLGESNIDDVINRLIVTLPSNLF